MKRANKTFSDYGSSKNRMNGSNTEKAATTRSIRNNKGQPVSNVDQNLKETKLYKTLHDAETQQLQTFIKTRNSQLDEDIRNLENKLNSDYSNHSSFIENDSLKDKASRNGLLGLVGKGIGKVTMEYPSSTDNSFNFQSGKLPISPSSYKNTLITLLARIKLSKKQYTILFTYFVS